jgi:hypothetical protein
MLLRILHPVRIPWPRAGLTGPLQSTVEELTKLRWRWQDFVIAILLSLAACYGSYEGAQLLDPAVVVEDGIYNIWFDADSPRVYATMTDRGSVWHEESSRRHPLFSILTFPIAYTLTKGLGIDRLNSVRLVVALGAFLWTIALYVVLRLIVSKRLDAVVFTLLAMASAGAMFWFIIPETFPFGSVTVLLALGVLAVAQCYRLSSAWYVAASAVSLSVTVTNWMAGILAIIVTHDWKRSFQMTINAFSIVVLVWCVQKFLFPTSIFFVGGSNVDDHIFLPESGGPLRVLSSLVFHTMIMPAIGTTYWPATMNLPVMTVQPSAPGSGNWWGAAAVLPWAILLSLGLWGLFSIRAHLQFRLVLGLTLLGQILLHIAFGRETFLYALHFLPLLVLLASLSTLTSARVLGLLLAGALIILLAINNLLQLEQASKFVRRETTQEAYLVRAAMKSRPNDPWPRSSGHVALAAPGSRETQKAYHEPGGSFSPSVGSFGVSIWITDEQGKLKTSSDNIPPSMFRQRLTWNDTGAIPAILTDSTYYRALWTSPSPGGWLLSLNTSQDAATRSMIVIRSVGPAGGPIRSLRWNGEQLVINSRWKVKVSPKPLRIHLGDEGPKGWMMAHSDLTQWDSRNGWGYARFELANGQATRLLIADTNQMPPGSMNYVQSPSAVEVELPDDRFATSLRAQVSHLLMGLVDHETRPGDPISYPFAWLRDEAYIVVALARAGQLGVAKELSRHLAEKDFFGGWGAEADAPGLAIWALVDIAAQLREPEYDRWLWPHVRRKADLIVEMLSADQPIRKPLTTPVIPLYTKPLPSAGSDLSLVAEPARNGLIIGRIHNARPVYYVNAVSYRGLLDAAVLAERVGRISEARDWRARAARLEEAWSKAFQTIPYSNNWNYSLWPTGIANQNSSTFLGVLEPSWLQYSNPSGNSQQSAKPRHFGVAEAHQWLLLGREDRPWSTLTALWNDQASPGLYTWSEPHEFMQVGRENTSRNWEQVRGWVKAPHFTPDYRTAAEVLLLQLDMLAHSDEAASEPTLVIGTGIQPSWLDQPMRVRGLSTRLGQVDWTWDGRQMKVKIRGSRPHVRLGPAWASSTPVRIDYAG